MQCQIDCQMGWIECHGGDHSKQSILFVVMFSEFWWILFWGYLLFLCEFTRIYYMIFYNTVIVLWFCFFFWRFAFAHPSTSSSLRTFSFSRLYSYNFSLLLGMMNQATSITHSRVSFYTDPSLCPRAMVSLWFGTLKFGGILHSTHFQSLSIPFIESHIGLVGVPE